MTLSHMYLSKSKLLFKKGEERYTWRQWLTFLKRFSLVLSDVFCCFFIDILLSTRPKVRAKKVLSIHKNKKVPVPYQCKIFTKKEIMTLSQMNLSKSRSKSKLFRFFAWTSMNTRGYKNILKRGRKKYIPDDND